MTQTTEIKLDLIRIDGGTQSRVSIDELTVADYADAMTEGGRLPPVVLFFDGSDHWLADGFHRYHAHCKIGMLNIDAEVHNGTAADAKLFSYGANKDHGLRRTNEDKRKAVAGMLADFGDWSDNKIAKHVGVDHKTVAAHRLPILGNSQDEPTTRVVERNGKTYEQNTANIGKAKPTEKPAPPVAVPEGTPDSTPATIVPLTTQDELIAMLRSEVACLKEEILAVTDIFDDITNMNRTLELAADPDVIKKVADMRSFVKVDSNAVVLAAVRVLFKEAS